MTRLTNVLVQTDVAPVFEELFGPLITRTFSFLNREVAGTDDAVERNELIRSYVAFISQLCANGLEGVIRSERNPNQLQVILQSLVFYANNGDVGVQRQTLNVLVRLVNLWGGSSTPNGSTASNNQAPSIDLPGFEQFIYETLVGLIFEIPSKPTFDFKDAQTQIVSKIDSSRLHDFAQLIYLLPKALTELCTLAKTIYQKRGNELLEYLTNVYLPRMQCPADMAQEFAQNLKRLEAKELRKALEVRRAHAFRVLSPADALIQQVHRVGVHSPLSRTDVKSMLACSQNYTYTMHSFNTTSRHQHTASFSCHILQSCLSKSMTNV